MSKKMQKTSLEEIANSFPNVVLCKMPENETSQEEIKEEKEEFQEVEIIEEKPAEKEDKPEEKPDQLKEMQTKLDQLAAILDQLKKENEELKKGKIEKPVYTVEQMQAIIERKKEISVKIGKFEENRKELNTAEKDLKAEGNLFESKVFQIQLKTSSKVYCSISNTQIIKEFISFIQEKASFKIKELENELIEF